MKTFKTRDSATALLKKMGLAKADYDLFIYRIEGGVQVDVEAAKGHLEQVTVTPEAPAADPVPEAPAAEAPAADPVEDPAPVDPVAEGDEAANQAEAGEEEVKELPAEAKKIADDVAILLKDGSLVLSVITSKTGVKRRRLMRILGRDDRFLRGSKGIWSLK